MRAGQEQAACEVKGRSVGRSVGRSGGHIVTPPLHNDTHPHTGHTPHLRDVLVARGGQVVGSIRVTPVPLRQQA